MPGLVPGISPGAVAVAEVDGRNTPGLVPGACHDDMGAGHDGGVARPKRPVQRPSTRFAMMLRWISLEPAKIVCLRSLKYFAASALA